MMRNLACARAAGVGLSVWVVGSALGQACEPGWGEGFANAPGFDGEVRAIAMFDDGSGPKLYAGGHFTSASGQEARGIARWDGDHWAEVGGGIGPIGSGNGVYWLGVLDTGGGPALYAGGLFQTAGGVPAQDVARWDGEVWSALGEGLNNTVRVMTVFDDGSGPAVYATGLFTASGTSQGGGLAKWTGTTWVHVASLQGGQGFSLGVFDLGQGPRLVVGGRFTVPSSTPGVYCRNIGVWDGQAWSALGPGVYGTGAFVMKQVMFDHGTGPQLTIGGLFSVSATGAPRPRVARWTGDQWVQVGSDLSAETNKYVNSMLVVPGSGGPSLCIGGWFAGATWLNAVNYTARFGNGDWVGLDGGMAGADPVSSHVRCMILSEEAGEPVVYAAGAFTVAGDAVASRVAKWDGSRWHGLESGRGLVTPWSYPSLPAYGRTACAFDDGSRERTFVGGEFVGAGGRVCNSIAAWDGSAWHQVGGGLTRGGAPGQVYAFEAFDDGSGLALYTAGEFDQAGGTPCFGVTSWDGALWSAPGGNGLWRNNGSTWGAGGGFALKSFDDGSGPALYVGGSFEYAGASPAAGIARWNGTAWSGVGNGSGVEPTYTVHAIEAFDEGAGPRLFVGGGFTSFAGLPALGIVRWDGARWSEVGGGFAGAPGTMASVHDLAVLDDGSGPALIAVGGAGSVTPLVQSLLLAKWDGSAWSDLGTHTGVVPLTGWASRVWSFDDGSGPAIYVGGKLFVSGHLPPVGWLRLRDGTWELPGGGISHPPVPGNASVSGAAVRRDGDSDTLLITGLFTQAGEAASAGVAEWRGCAVCHADCNGDGALTPADFGCFQSRFVEGDPWADCNGSGALTVADFGCFQTKFVGGCQ